MVNKIHIPILSSSYVPDIVWKRIIYFYDFTEKDLSSETVEKCRSILEKWDQAEDGTSEINHFQFLYTHSFELFNKTKIAPITQLNFDKNIVRLSKTPINLLIQE